MLRFRPDIKPPAWGGRAEVEFAVRANCERLGLPMPLAWSPIWGNPAFGGEIVGQGAWDAEGVDIFGATGVSFYRYEVPVVSLPELYTFVDGVHDNSGSASFFITTNGAILRSQRLSANNFRIYADGGYLSSSNMVVQEAYKVRATQSTGYSSVLAQCSHAVCSSGNLRRATVASSTTKQIPIPDGQYLQLPWKSKWRVVFFWGAYPSGDVDAQLHYEPYTLLMPVARPVYFDLAQASEDKTSQAHIVHTHSLTASGAKGISAKASLSHSHSMTATGTKQEASAGAGTAHVAHAHSLNIVGVKSASIAASLTHAHSITATGTKAARTTVSMDHSSAMAASGVRAESYPGAGAAHVAHRHAIAASGAKRTASSLALAHFSAIMAAGAKYEEAAPAGTGTAYLQHSAVLDATGQKHIAAILGVMHVSSIIAVGVGPIVPITDAEVARIAVFERKEYTARLESHAGA